MVLMFSVLAGVALLITLAFGVVGVMMMVGVKTENVPSSVDATYAPSRKSKKLRS